MRLDPGLVTTGIFAFVFLAVGVEGLCVVCIVSDGNLLIVLVDRQDFGVCSQTVQILAVDSPALSAHAWAASHAATPHATAAHSHASSAHSATTGITTPRIAPARIIRARDASASAPASWIVAARASLRHPGVLLGL